MLTNSLHVLHCGSLVVDKGNVLTYRVDIGKSLEIPALAYLIKTESGNILFDSGIDKNDLPYLRSIGKEIKTSQNDDILNRLRENNLSVKDVNYIVQSHLHWDHSGLLKAFPNARIIVQRQEYGFAINPPSFATAFYRRSYYDSPDLQWQIIDGDENILPGVTAVSTPGHTPGHQSLMISLPESGTIILSGDCAYISENVDNVIIPGIFINPTEALHSIKKLKTLTLATNGRILHSHSWPGIDTYK